MMQIGLILVLIVGLNTTNASEILDYVENNIIHGLDDTYCVNDVIDRFKCELK